MRITVVTAVWNRAETVEDALESVASQDHRDVEHVVQDGGSTDGTQEILQSRENIALVSEPDDGIYDAINRGIARSTGEIVGLLHSDDVFASQSVLSRVAEAFVDPEVDAVYGDLDYVAATNLSKVIRHWSPGHFTPQKLARGWMPPHPTLYLRRNVFETCGLYDTSYRIAGDYDGILRYFSQPGFKAVHVPEVLVKMRVGGASNRSLSHILRKSREDFRALRKNEVGGVMALAAKNLSKVGQFLPVGTK
ncbi:MAG: glycosyltransferase family 2 protein [Pseudomonadota bacterium]